MIPQFKTLKFDELCELLCQKKTTLIMYHIRSDADAVGSAFALKELLGLMDIPSYCACSDEIPDRLRFLADGKQGSVLVEDGMKIGCERIITVDSASPSQLGDLFNRVHKNIDLMIDHHAMGTPYADNFIDPTAAATGEIIYRIAKYLLKKKMIAEIPDGVLNCVYAAISSDTGGFRFSNASPNTYRLAAELVENGVDCAEINRQLFDSKSFEQLKAEGVAIKNLCLHDGGRIASTLFSYSEKKDLGVSDDDLGTLIDIPRSVFGVEIAFVVKQESNDGKYRVSMRSATDFDVSKVCAAFGGGGHKRAAGCTVEADNIEEAEQKILDIILA